MQVFLLAWLDCAAWLCLGGVLDVSVCSTCSWNRLFCLTRWLIGVSVGQFSSWTHKRHADLLLVAFPVRDCCTSWQDIFELTWFLLGECSCYSSQIC